MIHSIVGPLVPLLSHLVEFLAIQFYGSPSIVRSSINGWFVYNLQWLYKVPLILRVHLHWAKTKEKAIFSLISITAQCEHWIGFTKTSLSRSNSILLEVNTHFKCKFLIFRPPCSTKVLLCGAWQDGGGARAPRKSGETCQQLRGEGTLPLGSIRLHHITTTR